MYYSCRNQSIYQAGFLSGFYIMGEINENDKNTNFMMKNSKKMSKKVYESIK